MGKKRDRGAPQTIAEYGHEHARDHKNIKVRKASSLTIKWAYDADHGYCRYPVNAETPDDKHLFNFDLPVGKLGPLLVLDHYGDETLSPRFRRKLLTSKYGDDTIGVFRKSGEIVRIGFTEEYVKVDNPHFPSTIVAQNACIFWRFEPKIVVPLAWRGNLDEVKTMKRPFRLTLHDWELVSFMDRWADYNDLQKNLIVELRAGESSVQIWGESWRTVSEWSR